MMRSTQFMKDHARHGFFAVLPITILMLLCTFKPGQATSPVDTAKYYANLRYKISVDKTINVAYFGGSITQGGNASDKTKTSYRALTTAWLKANVPLVTITENDASWGSSGTDLGAFRCTRDVTSLKPDLVFVEFAVNDWAKDNATIQPYIEGIVRNILRSMPNCVVIFIYTVHNNTIAKYDQGTYPVAVLAQQAVANYYGIGSINVGKKLWEYTKSSSATITTLTTDGTHPNDQGHKIYADEIAGVLKRYLLTPPAPAAYAPVTLPTKPLTANVIDNGVFVPADQLSSPGWKVVSTGEVRFPNQIVSNTPNSVFTYKFKGTAIGMDWVQGGDGGEMQWSVDNVASGNMSAYYGTGRGLYVVLTNTLLPGDHTLTMKVLSNKNSASSGNYLRMGALFVDADLPVTGLHGLPYNKPKTNSYFEIVNTDLNAARVMVSLHSQVKELFTVDKIDLNGSIVKCLFKGSLDAGFHTVNLENTKVSPGMFFLRVKTMNHGQTIKTIRNVK